MLKISFYNQNEISDEMLKFAVIAAKYNGKWIFCRHKERSTWEIPGGHREPGETILETAKRELYEETGAVGFDIMPACIYRATKYGMLFFAEVKTLGALPPDFEITETMLFDSLPDNLTYPEIQPYLYERVQGWLNVRSGAGELWDIYDKDRNLTGRTHRRGDPMNRGDYHLVVQVWIINSKGEYLLSKRSPNKGFPLKWEPTGGSAVAGEDSLASAIREVREELGIELNPTCGTIYKSFIRDAPGWENPDFLDVWIFRHDCPIEDVTLQEGETCGAMWASRETVKKLRDEGKLVPISYLDEFYEAMGKEI